MNGACDVHPHAPALGRCPVCRRECCERCLEGGLDVCATCLGARALPAEAELQAIGLLDMAVAGAWLLFGTTLFAHFLAPLGLRSAGIAGSVAIAGASLAAAFAARSGYPILRWLQPFLAPMHVGLVAGLFSFVDWGRLPELGLVLWLFMAQALLLFGLLSWSVLRVHSPATRPVFEPEYRRLRAATDDVLPTPFPFYWSGSILVWLFLQMTFLVVYRRIATGAM